VLDLTTEELQKLVLMTGSKTDLGTYLGLDPKATDQLWKLHNLMTPLTWLREQSRTEQLELLARAGSLEALAKKIGASEAGLRPIYMGEPTRELDWDLDHTLAQFERYRSVKLVAHMNDTRESLVRKVVEKHELELATLIDYSFGGTSNAKGRRAELDFAALRAHAIKEDLNLTKGSQAEYDFDDLFLGRVNVKSSREYRFRARTRRENPRFYKFSTSGHENCDRFVCLCYDAKMQELLGVYVIQAQAAKHTKTITITAKDMSPPDDLRAGHLA
jgi:hypothetical protein